jgi:hypothetical protein
MEFKNNLGRYSFEINSIEIISNTPCWDSSLNILSHLGLMTIRYIVNIHANVYWHI